MRAGLLFWAGVLAAGAAQAETIVGLREDNFHLISFDSADPGALVGDLETNGFPTGVQPVSLDFRAGTGLVLIGQGPANTDCQQFSINTSSGAVTAVGAKFTCTATVSDVDWDPDVGDELRFMNDTGNYHVDAASGTRTTDTAADFPTADANGPDTPDIVGVAYDQNTATTGTTTLFALEAGNDVLVRVGSVNGNPTTPDSGILTTIGSLGVNVDFMAPFDISGASGTAYFARFNAGTAATHLHTVNLSSGTATLVGQIGAEDFNLLGMAVAPGTTLPAITPEKPDNGALAPLALLALLFGALVRRRQ